MSKDPQERCGGSGEVVVTESDGAAPDKTFRQACPGCSDCSAPTGTEETLKCGSCGAEVHSTLTDRCHNCCAKNYGQPSAQETEMKPGSAPTEGEEPERPENCERCKGSGVELRQGNGEWISDPCPDCDGTGGKQPATPEPEVDLAQADVDNETPDAALLKAEPEGDHWPEATIKIAPGYSPALRLHGNFDHLRGHRRYIPAPSIPLGPAGRREQAVNDLLELAKLADDDQMRDELENLASRFSLPPRPSIPLGDREKLLWVAPDRDEERLRELERLKVRPSVPLEQGSGEDEDHWPPKLRVRKRPSGEIVLIPISWVHEGSKLYTPEEGDDA